MLEIADNVLQFLMYSVHIGFYSLVTVLLFTFTAVFTYSKIREFYEFISRQIKNRRKE